MPYVCGLDCNLVRNDSQSKIQCHIFLWVRKKLSTEKNHICGTIWTDAVVSENLIFLFIFFALSGTVYILFTESLNTVACTVDSLSRSPRDSLKYLSCVPQHIRFAELKKN